MQNNLKDQNATFKPKGGEKRVQYLHPENNLLQNVVQTSSLLWRVQKPGGTAE